MMLREIMIENVAVIEKAGVQFGAGLNVLSGETGAGKSILIDSKSCFYTARSAQTAKAYAASTGCPPRRPWCARYAPG